MKLFNLCRSSGNDRRAAVAAAPRAGSRECGAIVASLPLSRTNRAILQQPFGFELTVPACLDSNQASATDPRPPNSSRTPSLVCKRVHLDGAPTTMPTPLFLRASGKIITLRQKRRTVGGSLRSCIKGLRAKRHEAKKKPRRVWGPGLHFPRPRMRLGKGACERNQGGNEVFQPQCNLLVGCALGATGEIGPTVRKGPGGATGEIGPTVRKGPGA